MHSLNLADADRVIALKQLHSKVRRALLRPRGPAGLARVAWLGCMLTGGHHAALLLSCDQDGHHADAPPISRPSGRPARRSWSCWGRLRPWPT